MANLHRARVCMVGSEQDMETLCRVLLSNYCEATDEEEILPQGVPELQERIRAIARRDGAEFDTFLYHMISDVRFGSAEQGTLRLEIRQQPCGLWTACFAYDSQSPFQVHEWLNLHKQCGRILTVIQRASWDFGAEKGELILTGGQTLDNWDGMGECWMWLIHQYEYGYPPEEAVERLQKLEATLLREDFDMTVEELLLSCEENLQAVALVVQDPEEVRRELENARAANDFPALADAQHAVAESVLWDTERNARWLATLREVRDLWMEKNA